MDPSDLVPLGPDVTGTDTATVVVTPTTTTTSVPVIIAPTGGSVPPVAFALLFLGVGLLALARRRRPI